MDIHKNMVIDCSKCPDESGCCGTIPFSKEFYEKHKDKIKVKPIEIKEEGDVIVAATENLKCVFLDPKTNLCAIYDDRPEVCRLFGTKEGIKTKGLGLACPYFKPNGKEWTPGKKRQIEHVNKKNVRKLLHRK